MDDRRFSLRVSTYYERFQQSLFYVPALYILGAGILAWATNWFDRAFAERLPELPFLLPTTVDSARSILSTIAGATITVAGVVFSLTVVAVQLTSSQFSPRVLRGLLRDRFSQNTIGVTVATFTYCLLVLAVTRSSGVRTGEEPLQNVAVTVAVILSVLAVLAIVAFLDHSARSMQVGEIIRRAAAETHTAIAARFPEWGEGASADPQIPVPDRDPDVVVQAEQEGWIQLVHSRAMLDALPAGATGRIAVRTGAYVVRGQPVVEAWHQEDAGEADSIEGELRRNFVIGNERTMQQDVAFGIRQIVDIALRALSPGINDPTTAIESMFRLGGILREIGVRDLPPKVLRDDEHGSVLVRSGEQGYPDFVRYAFRQIREVSVTQAGVIKMMVRVLGEVAEELRRNGLGTRVEPLREEVRLAIVALEGHGHLEEDLEPVREAAVRYGLA